MFSFVKELDESTLRLVRYLAEKEEGLWERHVYVVWVVWVESDKEALARWAAEHDINNLRLAVIGAEDETLRHSRSIPNTS